MTYEIPTLELIADSSGDHRKWSNVFKLVRKNIYLKILYQTIIQERGKIRKNIFQINISPSVDCH